MAQLNDLNDDCLLMVLDWLPPEELLKMMKLNQRLDLLATDKMRTRIKVISSKRFKFCDHLQTITFSQTLFLKPKLSLDDEPTRKAFLSLLVKCPGVKCFDFGNYDLPEGLLLEVFRLCPDIECIKLTKTWLNYANWDIILQQNGHKIVHFVTNCQDNHNRQSSEPESQCDIRLLATIAKNCPNIKRVDWSICWSLTNELAEAFKMLPKSSKKVLKRYFLLRDMRDMEWVNLFISSHSFDSEDVKLKLKEIGVDVTLLLRKY